MRGKVVIEGGWEDGIVAIIDDDHTPVITEAGPFRAPEGFTGVFGALGAEDADGDSLEWSKSGGADSPVFTLGEATGELSFNSGAYGVTDSADGDAEYELIVVVNDGHNQASTEVVVVVMTNVAFVSVKADTVRITEGRRRGIHVESDGRRRGRAVDGGGIGVNAGSGGRCAAGFARRSVRRVPR